MGVAAAFERQVEEFREAVVNRQVLHAPLLDPGIGHVEYVWMFGKLADDFRCAVRLHDDAARVVADFTEMQVGVDIAHSLFTGNLMNGLSLIFLIALPRRLQ